MTIIQKTQISNDPEAIAKTGFERNFAFIIGINNYTNGISPLKTAVNDAKKLVEILREKHGYQVWVCLDEVATLTNLNQLLEKILPEQVGENDRLLFYFAGHGVALNGDDGPAGYLIPQDAKQGETDSYVPMTKLHDALNKLPCRHFLGILDCCFAGAFRWSSTRDLLLSPKVIHKERYDRFITDPAWQIITSSASDQKASDNFKLDTERGQVGNHSPFASALLEALGGAADVYPPESNGKAGGDGVITATELYLYLRDRVEIPTEKYCLRQTPGIWCLNKHDKGEYIFLSPGHELNLPPAPPLDESKNPYRGLKSFEEEDSGLFFGRSELVEKLQTFIKTNSLTVVLGTSGSGKSSLVKAGLIPKLKQELKQETNGKWCILSPIRPGEKPFQALNNSLLDAGLPKIELQNTEKTLSESIATWSKKNPKSKLLIFIDQSEELITLCESENDRKKFFQQILTAISTHQHNLRVVLTLRSDFEPQIRDAGLKFVPKVLKLGNTVLKNYWQSGRFIVPAMTRGELREAIEKPAQKRVMYFQPHELVERLIDEVDNMPGGLPLLSFALSELYLKYLKRQRYGQFNRGENIDRALTLSDYQELGGVIQSLTQRADEEYQGLINQNPDYQQVIRHVMLRMVALGRGELARRRVPLSELEYPSEKNHLVKQVIESFTQARLLVEGQDAESNPYVEPAHDALVRGWEKLLTWKQKEEESLILQRRLTPAVVEWKGIAIVWEQNQQSGFQVRAKPFINWLDSKLNVVENFFDKINPSIDAHFLQLWQGNSKEIPAQFLWNTNPYLDVLSETLNSNNNWLNKVESEFIEKSIKQKRQNHNWRWRIAIAVMLGLSGLSIWAIVNSERAKRNIQISELRATAAEVKNLTSVKPIDALLRAVEAIDQPLSKSVFEVQSSLLSAVQIPKERAKLKNQPPVPSLQKDDCGSWKVEIDNDNKRTLRLSNLNKQVKVFQEHDDVVTSVAFSSNCKFIVSGSRDNSLRLWNLKGRQISEPLRGHESWIEGVAFSSDNKSILSSSKDGTIRRWDVNQEKFFELSDGTKFAYKDYRVALSKDGKVIIANGKQSIYRWLNHKKPPKQTDPKEHSSSIKAIAITDDGDMSVSVDEDGKINLWDRELKLIDNYKIDGYSPKNKFLVNTIAIAPDGKSFAIGTYDGNIILWHIQNKRIKPSTKKLRCENCEQINAITFSRDGKYIASGLRTKEGNHTVQLWDKGRNGGGKSINHPQMHTQAIESLVFSNNGDMIATGSRDNTVRLWNKKTLKQIGEPLQGHKGWVSAIAFSSDDKFIATGSWDNTVRLWDSQGNSMGSPFKGHTKWISSVRFSSDDKSIISGSAYDSVRWWEAGNQEDWLKKACSQLKEHPVFKTPQNSLQEGAKKTCQKYS
ncbi:MAG: caspase family protein [Cyanobacteria bacterium P01_A01_bin.84]